jgi:hypothetical protein
MSQKRCTHRLGLFLGARSRFAGRTATPCLVCVATEKRALACGLLPGDGALGGARALGALGGAACVWLALGCAWHRTSGCAKRIEGVGWLGSPAMAFYLSAGVSSMRHAVPHAALPVPARIWAALAFLFRAPTRPVCWVLGFAEGTACGRRICSHGVRTAGLGVEGCMRFGVERASHALTALWRGAHKLVALGCGSLHQVCRIRNENV